jgi:UPF0271 protein
MLFPRPNSQKSILTQNGISESRQMESLKRKVDINCDLGESYGRFKVGQDSKIMPHITSANVACGFHAGDPVTMAHTVKLAKKFGVAVGAHPGYPDLVGFGRREMKLTPEELKSYITYQVGALQAFAKASGIGLQHVKPHGALYDLVTRDKNISRTIAEAILSVDSNLILLGPPHSMIAKTASRMGLRVALEVFADRAYNPDGTLVSRSQPGSVIEEPKLVVERGRKMIEDGTVSAINGKTVHFGEVHTICVHGDTPNAVEMARILKTNLLAAKIDVKPIGSFL